MAAISATSLAALSSSAVRGNADGLLGVKGADAVVGTSRRAVVTCQAGGVAKLSGLNRRQVAGASLVLGSFLVASKALALIEADDDEELLEKVKKDRKAKIEKRSSLGSYKGQEALVQKAVYKLSSVGKAIDEGDLTAASAVIGASLDTDWLKELTAATSAVSTNADESKAAGFLSDSLSSLQTAVSGSSNDKAKEAFVVSAEALEKWTRLTGIYQELQGFE